MTKTPDDKRFPKPPLIAAALMILVSLGLAVTARVSDVGTERVSYGHPVQTRALRFEDRPNGSVAILDAADGSLVTMMHPGSSGFLRIVMRGLARERIAKGGGPEEAFELTRWDNGRLTISDPITGRRTQLVGFGPDSERVFATLLIRSEAQ